MKRALLTIDDGPSERCAELIEFLSSKQIGAVLFCRGDNLAERQDTAIKAIKAGFIIGNHSWSHADFNLLNESEARVEISKTHEIIETLYRDAETPRPTNGFRFPYGHRGATKNLIQADQELLHEYGYSNPLDESKLDWSWNVDCEDWHVDETNVENKLALAKKRIATLKDGGILDLHDQEANVRTRLFQTTIDACLELGLSFQTNAEIAALTLKKTK